MFFRIALIVVTACVILNGIKYSADASQAILTWSPATTNTDGTPLTDLGGYKVYYGNTLPGIYDTIVDVGNATNHIISDLMPGKTYYFAVTAYNLRGNESIHSNEVRKTILDVTYTGDKVRVNPHPDIEIEFSSLIEAGTVTVTSSIIGPVPPLGFGLGSKPLYYELTSTAVHSGPVDVCFNYTDHHYRNENRLHLFHFNGSVWEDITKSGYPDTVNNIICGTTASFSPFVIAEESSTAVTLRQLSTHSEEDHVVITWSTASETDNEGFIILRGNSSNGPFTSITPSMISAVGGPGMNAAYTFKDIDVRAGKTYYYQLQDIDVRGRVTTHQVIPITVAAKRPQKESYEILSEIDDKESVSIIILDENKKMIEKEIDRSPEFTEELRMIPKGAANRVQQDMRSKDQSLERMSLRSPNKENYHSSITHSSFSVSIEEDSGNIIILRKVGHDNNRKANKDLEISEESGGLLLSWYGKGKIKGFLINRSEKGRDHYNVISSLIPFFGENDNDVFHYLFKDTNIEPDIKYDYKLEVVFEDEKKV